VSDKIPPRRKNVLLVEDNAGDVQLIERAFDQVQHPLNLSTVASGEDALRFLRREGKFSSVKRTDLVLLDLNIPILSGHEVLKEIRSDRKLRRTPVVVLTGSETDEDIEASYELGSNLYLVKGGPTEKMIKMLVETWFVLGRLPPR
jgi:CheY-like chemotaxis protein